MSDSRNESTPSESARKLPFERPTLTPIRVSEITASGGTNLVSKDGLYSYSKLS